MKSILGFALLFVLVAAAVAQLDDEDHFFSQVKDLDASVSANPTAAEASEFLFKVRQMLSSGVQREFIPASWADSTIELVDQSEDELRKGNIPLNMVPAFVREVKEAASALLQRVHSHDDLAGEENDAVKEEGVTMDQLKPQEAIYEEAKHSKVHRASSRSSSGSSSSSYSSSSSFVRGGRAVQKQQQQEKYPDQEDDSSEMDALIARRRRPNPLDEVFAASKVARDVAHDAYLTRGTARRSARRAATQSIKEVERIKKILRGDENEEDEDAQDEEKEQDEDEKHEDGEIDELKEHQEEKDEEDLTRREARRERKSENGVEEELEHDEEREEEHDEKRHERNNEKKLAKKLHREEDQKMENTELESLAQLQRRDFAKIEQSRRVAHTRRNIRRQFNAIKENQDNAQRIRSDLDKQEEEAERRRQIRRMQKSMQKSTDGKRQMRREFQGVERAARREKQEVSRAAASAGKSVERDLRRKSEADSEEKQVSRLKNLMREQNSNLEEQEKTNQLKSSMKRGFNKDRRAARKGEESVEDVLAAEQNEDSQRREFDALDKDTEADAKKVRREQRRFSNGIGRRARSAAYSEKKAKEALAFEIMQAMQEAAAEGERKERRAMNREKRFGRGSRNFLKAMAAKDVDDFRDGLRSTVSDSFGRAFNK